MIDNKKIIVHISENRITTRGGMGRVEYNWKKSFEENQCQFIHVGKDEVNTYYHQFFFGLMAILYLKKNNIKPDAIIVHEPYAFWFKILFKCLVFMESHGIELRVHQGLKETLVKRSIKTKILFPLWRELPCKLSIKFSDYLLLLNKDDEEFVVNNFGVSRERCYIYKNGYNIFNKDIFNESGNVFTVLFNASWLERKGIFDLINAAKILYSRDCKVFYNLIGTGFTVDYVTSFWPDYLRSFLRITPSFLPEEEISYLRDSSIFVLPSIMEGQPLSLIQAMAEGKCCITTNADGQKDLIKDGDNGFLFEVGDYIKMAELIEKCYQDKILIENIGKNAKESIKDRTWDNVSLEVVEYILDKLD